LLLLRSAVGAVAALQGGLYLADPGRVTIGSCATGLLGVGSGIMLAAGFLTPVAGCVAGLIVAGIAFSWLPAASPNLFDTALPEVLTITVAAAVVLLGPGAISVDARLFGRREIIIPPTFSRLP
jgi:uncharacterized membrane protein YphA (DoxX/SURF4 family)